jgi:hypothetical protein
LGGVGGEVMMAAGALEERDRWHELMVVDSCES